MSLCTVTGNINTILGLPPNTTFLSGTIRFTLVLPPRVNMTPITADTGLSFPTQVDTPLNSNGTFSVKVQANDEVIPADTVYSVMYLVPNLNVVPQFYFITGTTYNINTAVQAAPQLPLPTGAGGALLIPPNTVFAGPAAPTTDPAAQLPSFRSLVIGDLPAGGGNVRTDAPNTFLSSSTIDLSAVNNSSGFLVPVGNGLRPTISGAFAFASDLGTYVAGNNGSTTSLPFSFGGTIGLCAQWTTPYQLGSVACSGSGQVDAGLQFAVPYYAISGTNQRVSPLTGPTSPNGVTQFLTETPSGGNAASPVFLLAGVAIRAVTTTSDTILAADRANYVTYNNGSAVGVTIPQAGTTNFNNNFVFGAKNLGAGAVTFTPTTSTIDGAATLVMNQGDSCTIYTDNANYFSRCVPTQLVAGTGISFSRTATGLTLSTAVGSLITAAATPITCNGSITLPFDSGANTFATDFTILLTGNCTVTSITGPFVQKSEVVVSIRQDGTGGHTFTWPANFLQLPVLGTGANSYTVATFQYCGSTGDSVCTASSWLNTDVGPAGAIPTLDAVLNPINNASFTFPATEGLTVLGTQPASVSGAGTAAGTLVTITTPQGGNSTAATGGTGGDYTINLGAAGSTAGGQSNAAARGGIFTVKGQAFTGGGTGTAIPNRLNFDMSGLASNGTGWGGANTFPATGSTTGGAGIFSRNTDSTAGNTINRYSPGVGMMAHMQINGVDTEQYASMILFPGDPSASSMTINNGNNPHITWLFEIPSNGFSPTYHYCFMQGGPCISTTNGGAGVGANGYFWSAGAGSILGNDPSGSLGQGGVTIWPAQPGNGSVGVVFQGRGSAGTAAGFADDDLKNTNGTWVFGNLMNNSSGGNIADGTWVKLGTANSVTPMLTTDTGANIVIGVVIVPGGGNCANATKCYVAYTGNLNGVVKMDSGTCSIGDALIASTVTNNGQVKCQAHASATFGTVYGYAASAQSTPGNTVDVVIRMH